MQKKTAAAEVASQMLRALIEGHATDTQEPVAPPPTLAEFARAHFLPWVESCGREEKTKETYRYGWSLLKNQMIGEESFAAMRMDRIRATHIEMLNVPGSPSTHNNALRTLRRMFSIAMDLDLIAKRPKIKLRDEHERSKLIDPATEERIAAELGRSKRKSALQLGLYVILDCGLRPKEIVSLKVEELHFFEEGDSLIRVNQSKTKAGERYVPMTQRVKEKLLVAVAGRTSGWVLRSPRYPGEHVQRHALTSAWRRVCNRAGVASDLNLYNGRHTYGTDVMKETKNPFLAMKLLGHTKLDTTRRYQHHDIAGVGKLMDQRNEARHTLRHTALRTPLQTSVTN